MTRVESILPKLGKLASEALVSLHGEATRLIEIVSIFALTAIFTAQ